MKPVSDAQTEKRLELELKLENDIREYNSLKQGLDNSNTVTQKMVHLIYKEGNARKLWQASF